MFWEKATDSSVLTFASLLLIRMYPIARLIPFVSTVANVFITNSSANSFAGRKDSVTNINVMLTLCSFRCPDGFAGQRCQFKKAHIDLPFVESKCINPDSVMYRPFSLSLSLDEACGPYGHDIHFREICAAWRRAPPITEMSSADFSAWQLVEEELKRLKRNKELEDLRNFKMGKTGVLSH